MNKAKTRRGRSMAGLITYSYLSPKLKLELFYSLQVSKSVPDQNKSSTHRMLPAKGLDTLSNGGILGQGILGTLALSGQQVMVELHACSRLNIFRTLPHSAPAYQPNSA